MGLKEHDAVDDTEAHAENTPQDGDGSGVLHLDLEVVTFCAIQRRIVRIAIVLPHVRYRWVRRGSGRISADSTIFLELEWISLSVTGLTP